MCVLRSVSWTFLAGKVDKVESWCELIEKHFSYQCFFIPCNRGKFWFFCTSVFHAAANLRNEAAALMHAYKIKTSFDFPFDLHQTIILKLLASINIFSINFTCFNW